MTQDEITAARWRGRFCAEHRGRGDCGHPCDGGSLEGTGLRLENGCAAVYTYRCTTCGHAWDEVGAYLPPYGTGRGASLGWHRLLSRKGRTSRAQRGRNQFSGTFRS